MVFWELALSLKLSWRQLASHPHGSFSLSCLPAFTTKTASPNRRPLSISPVAWVPLNRAAVLPGKGGVILRLTQFRDRLTLRSLLPPFTFSTSWAPCHPPPHLLLSSQLGRRCRGSCFQCGGSKAGKTKCIAAQGLWLLGRCLRDGSLASAPSCVLYPIVQQV